MIDPVTGEEFPFYKIDPNTGEKIYARENYNGEYLSDMVYFPIPPLDYIDKLLALNIYFYDGLNAAIDKLGRVVKDKGCFVNGGMPDFEKILPIEELHPAIFTFYHDVYNLSIVCLRVILPLIDRCKNEIGFESYNEFGFARYLIDTAVYSKFALDYSAPGNLFGDLARFSVGDEKSTERLLNNYFRWNQIAYSRERNYVDPYLMARYQESVESGSIDKSYKEWLKSDIILSSLYLAFHTIDNQESGQLPNISDFGELDKVINQIYKDLKSETEKNIQADIFDGETRRKHQTRRKTRFALDGETEETVAIKDVGNDSWLWLYYELHDRLWDSDSGIPNVDLLKMALRKLPYRTRIILFTKRKKAGEISKKMGISEDYFYVLKNRAIEKLKETIEEITSKKL